MSPGKARLRTRQARAEVCGYTMVGGVGGGKAIPISLVLPREWEEVPTLILQAWGTTPSGRLFGSILPSSGYAAQMGSVPQRERRAAQRRDSQSESL